MAKTLNDIIEDFDAQLNEKVKPTTDEEITKSVEEPTEPEKVEEGAEVEPEEKPNESEETAGNDGEESGVTETVEAEQEEPETVEEVAVEEPVEESAETVEKSDKTKENKDEEEEEDEEDEDKKKEKDKKDKDKKDKEDKEDIEKSTEVEQVIKSSEILGAMEAIFKNMLGLSEKLDEIHREFKEAKEKDEAESVEKSLLDNPEIKTGKEDSEGKAVGFVNKSVAVEEDVATEEPTVEVIVDGEQDTAEPEKEVPFRDRVQAIRPDFMETYKRVSVSGVAQRGELESVRHTWGTARTNDDLAKIEGFINKYK